MTSPWKKCSVKSLSFAVNPITLYTSVVARSRRRIVSIVIFHTTLNWCAVAARIQLRIACGIISHSNAVNFSIAWKPNWVYAMPLTPYRLGKLQGIWVFVHKIGCDVFFSKNNGPRLNMWSNRYTGPGNLKLDVHTEAVVSFNNNLTYEG